MYIYGCVVLNNSSQRRWQQFSRPKFIVLKLEKIVWLLTEMCRLRIVSRSLIWVRLFVSLNFQRVATFKGWPF